MESVQKKARQKCQAYFNHPNCTLKKLLIIYYFNFFISCGESSFLSDWGHHLFQFSDQDSFFPDQDLPVFPF